MTAALTRAAARGVARTRGRIRARRIERRFAAGFLGERRALDVYRREVRESGLLEHLRARGHEFRAALAAPGDGRRYTMGTIGYDDGLFLYAIARTLRPRAAVETGVCNGFSTAFILLALARNGDGHLHSIDLPEVVGEAYEPGTFWAGKGPAAIPRGKEPGWVIPDALAGRWTLVRGRSQDELPPLVGRLGTIDFFLHDSEHSYECMRFEYGTAWPALREGGILASDDVNKNPAFFEFALETGRDPVPIGPGMAFLVK